MKRKSKIIIWAGLLLFILVIIFLFIFSSEKKIITIENETEPMIKSENTEIQAEKESEFSKNIADEATVAKDFAGNGTDKVEKDEIKAENESREKKDDAEMKNHLIGWGFSVGRNQPVDTIIVHSVYNKLTGDQYDLNKIIGIFKDYGVAPHYIIERSGKVHQLVEEKNVAYHAGESEMPDGRMEVNGFSVGIEIINAEDDEPKSAQYKSLKELISGIESRYEIRYILGHSDIAPGRKTDPWNFDWDKIGGKKK